MYIAYLSLLPTVLDTSFTLPDDVQAFLYLLKPLRNSPIIVWKKNFSWTNLESMQLRSWHVSTMRRFWRLTFLLHALIDSVVIMVWLLRQHSRYSIEHDLRCPLYEATPSPGYHQSSSVDERRIFRPGKYVCHVQEIEVDEVCSICLFSMKSEHRAVLPTCRGYCRF